MTCCISNDIQWFNDIQGKVKWEGFEVNRGLKDQYEVDWNNLMYSKWNSFWKKKYCFRLTIKQVRIHNSGVECRITCNRLETKNQVYTIKSSLFSVVCHGFDLNWKRVWTLLCNVQTWSLVIRSTNVDVEASWLRCGIDGLEMRGWNGVIRKRQQRWHRETNHWADRPEAMSSARPEPLWSESMQMISL